jgi:hypothetical protein
LQPRHLLNRYHGTGGISGLGRVLLKRALPWTMRATSDTSISAPMPSPDDSYCCCTIQDLDDAAFSAVLSWLHATELATVALVCSGFNAAAKANLLWLQLVEQHFGIVVASTSTAEPAAAMRLYKQLLQGRPRALPCRGLSTDGGCDDPDSTTYWVSGMPQSVPLSMFVSLSSSHHEGSMAGISHRAATAAASAGMLGQRQGHMARAHTDQQHC